MLPQIVNDQSIMFFADGQPWTVGADHVHFERIRDLLVSGSEDVRLLTRLCDVRIAVEDATGGRGQLTEDGLFIDGAAFPEAWAKRAIEAPEDTRVLLVKPGDRIRVSGDTDAEDGIYTVGDVDDSDIGARVYVESEDGFFGFVQNASIAEILA